MSHPGLEHGPIYLDYNATTPVDPRVVEAALRYLTSDFGNPSSAHRYAAAPRQAVAQARGRVAQLLGARPGEIVFTGGGSESDTLAIRGAALANRDRGDQVITQATEHPAVIEACRSLEADGYRVTCLPVDRHGRVDPAALRAAISERTVLVSIMAGNAETGTLQPVTELAAIARGHGALFHTDRGSRPGRRLCGMGDGTAAKNARAASAARWAAGLLPGIAGSSRWQADAGIAGDAGADCHPWPDPEPDLRAPRENRGRQDGKHVTAWPEPNGEAAIGTGPGAGGHTGTRWAGPHLNVT